MGIEDFQKSHLIYNIFPRLIPSIEEWTDHFGRIKSMGFNCIYINPFHETGGSKSLYAVKDYYRLNPDFLPPGYNPKDMTILKNTIEKCKEKGFDIFMDLVINHTANESPLIQEHPQWFKRDNGNLVHPYAIDPLNASHITVWGDLAEINYDYNPDLTGLRTYWETLINFYQEIGFTGFRCDAAYKVPFTMWQPLIEHAKRRDPNVLFLAETLGCTLDQVNALRSCGFDYLFNSSKWWNFDNPWCIDQQNLFKSIAPSISFPESHDTVRVPSEPPGTINWQKNRYVLASMFSKGVLMPIGYEYGMTRQLHVTESKPEHLHEQKWDLQEWIRKINHLKISNKCLSDEGRWSPLWGYDSNVLFLLKESDDHSCYCGFLVNKDWYNETTVWDYQIPREIKNLRYRIAPFDIPDHLQINEGNITMSPSEILLFTN